MTNDTHDLDPATNAPLTAAQREILKHLSRIAGGEMLASTPNKDAIAYLMAHYYIEEFTRHDYTYIRITAAGRAALGLDTPAPDTDAATFDALCNAVMFTEAVFFDTDENNFYYKSRLEDLTNAQTNLADFILDPDRRATLRAALAAAAPRESAAAPLADNERDYWPECDTAQPATFHRNEHVEIRTGWADWRHDNGEPDTSIEDRMGATVVCVHGDICTVVSLHEYGSDTVIEIVDIPSRWLTVARESEA